MRLLGSRMYYLIRTSFTKRRRFASFLCREYTAAEKQREQQLMTAAADCRAEGAAVHSSAKRKRKNQETSLFGIIFLTLFHFLIHGALASKRLRLETFL